MLRSCVRGPRLTTASGPAGLIIEAKANHGDDVGVAHGMGQAMYYRSIDPRGPDARIAVLLRGEPGEAVARLLRTYDVGLIFRQRDGFAERLAW